MKKIKILIAVLLSLCLAFAVTGCSGDNLKDSVINGFNDMLQHFSKYALTDEKDLQGDKTKGEDTYTGSYTADYEDFNDKESIFGGTALERDKGSELTVTYEPTVDSGRARLYWLDKGEEKMIAVPAAFSFLTVSISSSTLTGSTPEKGSSKITRRGRWP